MIDVLFRAQRFEFHLPETGHIKGKRKIAEGVMLFGTEGVLVKIFCFHQAVPAYDS